MQIHEIAALRNYAETLQRGSLHTAVACVAHSPRTGNGKHTDVASPTLPAVRETDISYADRASFLLRKFWNLALYRLDVDIDICTSYRIDRLVIYF